MNLKLAQIKQNDVNDSGPTTTVDEAATNMTDGVATEVTRSGRHLSARERVHTGGLAVIHCVAFARRVGSTVTHMS